jgi:hypothetical protein
MKNQALDYYIHDQPSALRFQLKGVMSGEGARRLEQVWHTASSLIGDRRPVVDITFVTGVDEEGRALLLRWEREGAHFIADSKTSRALAESILETVPAPPAKVRHRCPSPRSFFQAAPSLALVAIALLFPFPATAATLKPETVAAWDEYLDGAQADLQKRVAPGGCFLWTFENSGRAARVHSGEILIAPAPGLNPKAVPGGLIHHWIGAIFLPDLSLEQVVEVTRDYDRYKDYYGPAVIDSSAIARDAASDQFSMRIMNKVFFLKTALDADYQATFVHLDQRRTYSVSRTTRLQEIDQYGETGEHKVPEGQGSGYVWKLFSITRFEQRDAGVYVELEAIALSREIPPAARFFVDPIVRRVSRNSMSLSLQQTRKALSGNADLTAPHAGIPAGAGYLPSPQTK